MSVATVVTRGYGAFGTVPDVVRAGYTPGAQVETPVVTATIQVGDGGPSWQDFVTAEFRKNHVLKELKQEEKKLETLEKRIVQAKNKLKKSEHPDGILANLFKLEMKRDEVENKIEALRVEMIPLERFIDAEIDEDDEEMLLL